MPSKQVQIDWDLFLDLYSFFFDDEEAPTGYQADEIRRRISEKVDKLISRELFTKYKRTPTGAEREQARQEYLNHREISSSFRSDTEYHLPEPPEK